MNNIDAQLLKEELAQVYLVHGSDRYRQQEIYRILYQRIVDEGFPDWNWANIGATKNQELDTIVEQLQTTPWGNGSKIVAVTEAENIPAETLNKLVTWLERNQSGNCLVLFFNKLDRRLKAVKDLLSMGVEIKTDPIKGDQLIRWIKDYLSLKNFKMSNDALEEFIARVGNDLNQVNNELDKLMLYVDSQSTISLTHVETVTSVSPGQLEHGVIFKMVEEIAGRNSEAALVILRQLLDEGEPALRILPLIERQLRLLLAANTLGRLSVSEAAKLMGESQDYALRKVQRYQSKFTLEQLYAGFKQVLIADSELKYGADPEQTLAQLILQICG